MFCLSSHECAGFSLEYGQLPRAYTPKGNRSFLFAVSLGNCSLTKDGTLCPPPSPCCHLVCLELAQASCMLSNKLYMNIFSKTNILLRRILLSQTFYVWLNRAKLDSSSPGFSLMQYAAWLGYTNRIQSLRETCWCKGAAFRVFSHSCGYFL